MDESVKCFFWDYFSGWTEAGEYPCCMCQVSSAENRIYFTESGDWEWNNSEVTVPVL